MRGISFFMLVVANIVVAYSVARIYLCSNVINESHFHKFQTNNDILVAVLINVIDFMRTRSNNYLLNFSHGFSQYFNTFSNMMNIKVLCHFVMY